MKTGLSIFAIFVISLVQAADRRETGDFKTFNPEQYFKQGLFLDAKGKVARSGLEKYCDRLQQFLTLLVYQQKIAELFCKIIPAIGPSEHYEKYRFVDGWCIDGFKLEMDNFTEKIVDDFPTGHARHPGVIGLLVVKKLPAISLALSTSKGKPDDSLFVSRIMKVLQEALSSEDEEVRNVAGVQMHSLLALGIMNVFHDAPIAVDFWTHKALKSLKTTGNYSILDTLLNSLKVMFPDVFEETVKQIPLLADMLLGYQALYKAYIQSGPLESTTGIKITQEFKAAKQNAIELLNKLKLYSQELEALYIKTKKALFDARIPFKGDHKKYLLFGQEFISPLITRERVAVKELISLPDSLDYSCLKEEAWQEKKEVEQSMSSGAPVPKSSKAHAPVEIQKPQESKKILQTSVDTIKYNSRVMAWLKPEFIKNKSIHDVLYHTFSFLVDPILKRLGKESTFITKERKNNQTYHLAGEIEYLSGPKQGKKELYVFVNTYDQSGVLYHRGIEPIKKDENFFQDFFSKSYANVEYPELGTQFVKAPANGHDAVLSENDYSIVIYDSRNNIRITLLKPLEGLSYN